MTDLPRATPDLLWDAVIKLCEERMPFKDVQKKHGRFQIEDIDKISYKTPAAFVSIPSFSPKEIRPNSQIRLAVQVAIMMVTSSRDTRAPSPSELGMQIMTLIHGNAFGLSHISHPRDMTGMPAIEGASRGKKQALTAFTWFQDMTVDCSLFPAFEKLDGVTSFKIGDKTYSKPGRTTPDIPDEEKANEP